MTSLPPSAPKPAAPSPGRRYGWAVVASLVTALVTFPLLNWLDLANVAMLFLLTVVLVSVRYGRRASVVATLVGVSTLALTEQLFALDDLQYGVTVVVMLAVGLITGKLTADLRYQVGVASQREARSRALYEFARTLSGVLQMEQVFESTRAYVQSTFAVRATLLLPDADGKLQYPVSSIDDGFQAPKLTGMNPETAQWAFDHAKPAGAGSGMFADTDFFYLPLVAPMRTRGILVIQPQQPYQSLAQMQEQRKQLETFAALAAIALERVHYIEVAQDALVRMESERLRNSLLAALSHDLRTPLTTLVGLSESLSISAPPLAAAQLEMAFGLRDEALRMSSLVSNLLDMARIQNRQVKLNMEWQFLEEVVGSALRASKLHLSAHAVQTRLAPGLPLVCFDAVLIERVLCNLLENAVKYTPPGSTILLQGEIRRRFLQVAVIDNGPGVPSGQEDAIFEKFTRGERESNKPGVGLGLSICRAIVEAHGGTIAVTPAPQQGAAFVFSLPLGTPPELPAPDLAPLYEAAGVADESATDASNQVGIEPATESATDFATDFATGAAGKESGETVIEPASEFSRKSA